MDTVNKSVIYQDEIYSIYEQEGAMFLNFKNSCKYQISSNEGSVIKYLISRIDELSKSS
jgi:hypothetical protein